MFKRLAIMSLAATVIGCAMLGLEEEESTTESSPATTSTSTPADTTPTGTTTATLHTNSWSTNYEVDTDALIAVRQSFGIQREHSEPLQVDTHSCSNRPSSPTFNSTADGNYLLFASQFERHQDAGSYVKSKEGGYVYLPGDGHSLYINVKAPENGELNITATDTLVIQVGNGTDSSANPNTHDNFTITLNGGTQTGDDGDANLRCDWIWSDVCSTTIDVSSSTHQFGLKTHYIPLSSFTCAHGSMDVVKKDLHEIVVSVDPENNATQAQTTTQNSTMPSVGFIGFTDSNQGNFSGTPEYLLFASQYDSHPNPNAGGNGIWLNSKEGGDLIHFGNTNSNFKGDAGISVNYSGDPNYTAPGFETVQGWGTLYYHTSAATNSDYVGTVIKAPNDDKVNAGNANHLVIQLGNMAWADGGADPNSHMKLVVGIKDVHPNSCDAVIDLEAGSRPPTGGSNTGLRTYYISKASDFNSTSCDWTNIDEVSVKLVGGNEQSADSSTSGNATYPVVGFIAFKK